MRIVVVGGSGNVGSALLAVLREDADASVVAVARRTPSTRPPEPYDRAHWEPVDLAVPGPDEPVVERLAGVFAGADAVVHLAWALQPTHRRDVLRRTNVDGTRRVVAAVARARVPHLVVASSVGAYSPVDDDVPRAESWRTDGVRSSAYSVDKVAVERLLDEAEQRATGLLVARVRPALIFQGRAGSAIERYFLGPLAPAAVLRHPLPLLPWPRGVRVQAVHAHDVARLYREILVRGAAGAFNVAAADVLRAQDVADVVAEGRWAPVPVSAVRGAVAAAWHARAVAVSPGWVDLARGVPLLDTTRAAAELGWSPRWSGQAALAELVEGMARGRGTASPVLRPRRRARRSVVGGQTDLR